MILDFFYVYGSLIESRCYQFGVKGIKIIYVGWFFYEFAYFFVVFVQYRVQFQVLVNNRSKKVYRKEIQRKKEYA